jgi:hypothetical protein
MANEQAPLSVAEFTRWSRGQDKTLERIDNKLDDYGQRIAVVETKLDERTGLLAPEDAKKLRNTSVGWSAGIAGSIIAFLEILHRVGILGK